MFMRVRRTVPHFTFVFSEGFVNPISSVSTGFLRFLAVFVVLRPYSGDFRAIKREQQPNKSQTR